MALYNALKNGHRDATCMLLDHGANIHSVELTMAVHLNDKSIIEKCIERGVSDINLQLISHMMKTSNPYTLRLIYSLPADYWKCKEYTPLHVAITHKRADLIGPLVDYGIDINQRAMIGMQRYQISTIEYTPLHQAVYNIQSDMVDVLLKHGADAKIKDMIHQTPMTLAMSLDHRFYAKDKARMIKLLGI